MNEAIKITVTAPAWLMPNHEVRSFLERVKQDRHPLDCLTFWNWDAAKHGYTRVGEADVTVRLFSEDTLVANQLKAYQVELDLARAEWMRNQQAILDKITKLQALPNEVRVLDAESREAA